MRTSRVSAALTMAASARVSKSRSTEGFNCLSVLRSASPVSRAANGPGPQIIARTSDEVDVLRNNGWQLLLCQITRGYNRRVVW